MAAWKAPRLGELRGPDAAVIRAIFHDLERFLAEPTFENGIDLGDGVKTYDPVLGITSQVETHKVIVDSTTDSIAVEP